MIQVYSEALQKTIRINRVIGEIKGVSDGPTIVFFSGIHGNEPAGVFALEDTLNKIKPEAVKGSIYGFSGNLKALEFGKRYISEDLNRLWMEPNLKALVDKGQLDNEEAEQLELFTILNTILNTNKEPFYFIDLHTTSVETAPFITINDALINRKFSKQFPVPIVLGIEEFLNGPLLSYINTLGYVSLGFESGQHDQISAITNSIAFINLCLVYTNNIARENILDFKKHYNQLKTESKISTGFFEVIDLHKIKHNESFKMLNGFENFQLIKKGTTLALSSSEKIKSKYNAQIFMPLYQKLGNEGFFIIKKIKPFFLRLSAILRLIRIDELLALLPGVSWLDSKKHVLQVNLKTARYLTKSVFHLLGYRSRNIDKTHLMLSNRERTAKTKMYKKEIWYKSGF